MTNKKNLVHAMNNLEVEINRQQKYIMKHGDQNDQSEYDQQWEDYKKDADYNLKKWDEMNAILRDFMFCT